MSDITKISEVLNDLLKRKELAFHFPYKNRVTPKKDEVVKDLSALLRVDASHIFLKKIQPMFGKQEAIVTVNVYTTPEELKKIEVINKKPKKREETPKPEAKK